RCWSSAMKPPAHTSIAQPLRRMPCRAGSSRTSAIGFLQVRPPSWPCTRCLWVLLTPTSSSQSAHSSSAKGLLLLPRRPISNHLDPNHPERTGHDLYPGSPWLDAHPSLLAGCSRRRCVLSSLHCPRAPIRRITLP